MVLDVASRYWIGVWTGCPEATREQARRTRATTALIILQLPTIPCDEPFRISDGEHQTSSVREIVPTELGSGQSDQEGVGTIDNAVPA